MDVRHSASAFARRNQWIFFLVLFTEADPANFLLGSQLCFLHQYQLLGVGLLLFQGLFLSLLGRYPWVGINVDLTLLSGVDAGCRPCTLGVWSHIDILLSQLILLVKP